MLQDEYLELGSHLADALPTLTVTGIHLPPLPPAGVRGDCFGVLFLSDGSAGPFYVGLGDSLAELHFRLESGNMLNAKPKALLHGFVSEDLAVQALALGVFNALSQSLMRRADYLPPRATRDEDPVPGELIGMVGFFGRLARPWAEKGVRIRVLELAPERIEDLPGILPVTDASELAQCSRIICTSSVLVNRTLDDIIAAVGDPGRIDLVGPSGSGLPDVVLHRGIRSIGGVFLPDSKALHTALDAGGHWGGAGLKYRLDAGNYPGIQALVSRLDG